VLLHLAVPVADLGIVVNAVVCVHLRRGSF
jgi:hypothetical protein